MRIVELSLEYIDTIAELEKLCFSQPLSSNSLKMLLPNGIGQGFVMLDDKEVAAYGGIIFAADEGQILNIATHPSCRRRGCARSIMKHIIDFAKEKGIAFITLEVRQSNIPARSLYESLGFYQIGVRREYYDAPKEDGLVLRLDLVSN